MARPDSTARPDQLTVLTTLGDITAVKTFGRGGKELESYGRAKTFTHREIEIDDRGDWLRALGSESQSFVVLGEVIDRTRRKIRRLSADRDGDAAQIRDVHRSWIPLDIDQIDIDFELVCDIDDIRTIARHVMRRLGIQGTHCVAHLSNSHGFGGKYRIRLWLKLAKPLTAAQMKALWRERWGGDEFHVDAFDRNGKRVRKPIVDPAVFQPQQPIYTGDPILVDVASPVESRVALIKGRPLELRVAKSKRKAQKPADENIAKLDAAGLYIRRLKPGQHMVRCPWEEEHSGKERDDDTFYFEPNHNGHAEPRFVCHHATHKDSKWWADVLEVIESRRDSDGEGSGFVLVTRRKEFWDPADGTFIDRESYDIQHGGKTKRGTPTERFIADRKNQRAHIAEFLPGHQRFIQRGKIRVLNTYTDQRVAPDLSVDVRPWTEHLEWCVPDERDRERLCDWLAWVYQQPGQKITWAPILYGPPGVGKTTVFNCLAQCVGSVHVSEPTQAELEDKFNDWAFGKLLVKIEELMSGDKFHVAEKLKPIVANPTVSIRRMHQTGFSVPNMANVCASTNHMQSLPIERSDRRYMLIKCVEAGEDERRPRMRAFHAWLEQAGYGGIAHWLKSRDVSEFVPTAEAPMTKLKAIVAEASKTDFDRAVDLCDVFDGQEVVTSVIVAEYLAANECPTRQNRLGLIAAQRKWTALPDKEGRCLVSGRKVTVWAPGGDKQAIREFVQLRPEARSQRHEALSAKLSFDPVARPKLTVHKGGKSDE